MLALIFSKTTYSTSPIFVTCLVLLSFLISVRCTSDNPEQSSNIEQKAKSAIDEDNPVPIILFFGNSLTAGYGIEPELAFPQLIQDRIDSLSLSYKVINAGLSGETTASGVNRIEWVLREPVEIMVLELGGNDGLRGIDPNETAKNLQQIVDLALAMHPDMKIIIAGMEAPPNMGETYISTFRQVFKDISASNELALIPFLLEGVGGEPDLNLADGIHPNEQGHKIVANNVWEILKPLL